jgi:rhodanese-related sulfurtransferase
MYKATMKLKIEKSLLTGALFAIAVASAGLTAAGELQTVDVKQGYSLQSSGALLLDVREPDEYAQEHAPGSTLIPLGQLEQRLQEIDAYKNKPVAVICHSGRRSAQALKLLERAGFSAAVNLDGGMIAWKKARLPIISGTASR